MPKADPYISLVKRLAVDDKLDFDTAKILITAYPRQRRRLDMEMAARMMWVSLLVLLIWIVVGGILLPDFPFKRNNGQGCAACNLLFVVAAVSFQPVRFNTASVQGI